MKKKINKFRAVYELSPLEGVARCLMNLENEALKNDLAELAEDIKLAREEAEASLMSPLREPESLSLRCH